MQQRRCNHYRNCLLCVNREILQVDNARSSLQVVSPLVLCVCRLEKLGLVDGSKDWPIIDPHSNLLGESRELETLHVLKALDIR
jgi:hypothetical protein